MVTASDISNSPWCYADIWRVVADAVPARPALVQGDVVIPWGAFDQQAVDLACRLSTAGIGRGDRVAFLMATGPAFAIGLSACFKLGAVPVGINHRYRSEEIARLMRDSGARVLIHAPPHQQEVAQVSTQNPDLLTIRTSPGRQPFADAEWIEPANLGSDVLAHHDQRFANHVLIYTGGTTGTPKGVLWPQHALFLATGAGAQPVLGLSALQNLGDVRVRALASALTTIIATPLHHGAGLLNLCSALSNGGTVVFPASASFDAEHICDEIDRLRANVVVIAGSAFAVPLVDALEANRDRWRLDSLRMWRTSAAALSRTDIDALLTITPDAAVFDSLGSTEAVGVASAIYRFADRKTPVSLRLGPNAAIVKADGSKCDIGETGQLAVSGALPLGYLNEPALTLETFQILGGQRWAITGDWARLGADGAISLLGRGSLCINSGGEKIFVEEVEAALKSHQAVADALVVGLPDRRFGEIVAAAIQLRSSYEAPTEEALRDHVRGQIAAYKVPRRIVIAEDIGRQFNGKPNYAFARTLF